MTFEKYLSSSVDKSIIMTVLSLNRSDSLLLHFEKYAHVSVMAEIWSRFHSNVYVGKENLKEVTLRLLGKRVPKWRH